MVVFTRRRVTPLANRKSSSMKDYKYPMQDRHSLEEACRIVNACLRRWYESIERSTRLESEDIQQEIAAAYYEGCTIKQACNRIQKFRVRNQAQVEWGRGDRETDKKLVPILSFYELFTFEETCEKFGLEPTKQLRKLFSQACPKPELGKQNGFGKGSQRGNRVEISPDASNEEIMSKHGVSRITAWRGRQRGYLYASKGKVENIDDLFSAKAIMDALLESEYQDEIISTLAISENYSFYFRLRGQLYRVSNHASRDWSQRLGQEEYVDISPATWDRHKKESLIFSLIKM